MGVPKFYRWLSERYPLINQRHGVRPDAELARQHLDRPPPEVIPHPDPLSTCGLPPLIDRLYVDMNGIIHGCSHNNNQDSNDADAPDENAVANITEPEIFANISYYLDRLVKEIAQPTELLYIAIDGVAPRAKLNQQRARRYRSAQEGEIEQTVYDAHKQALQAQQARQEAEMADYNYPQEETFSSVEETTSGSSNLREVEPGRFTGKFETTKGGGAQGTGTNATDSDDNNDERERPKFHSNEITPGTPFFQRCTAHMEKFLRDRLANDPAWQHLTVVFSGPNTPGEGEHKIMQFMREQKCRDDYNPNLRHCIMGQDGDLIMLGLVTHEPNLVLLREQVLFDKKRRAMEDLANKYGLDLYMFNPNFEFLQMNVLRDYLALEFETSNVVPSSPFDIERTIDDFVFLTFFVGNDFLPHMPALDIGDEALDLLFYTYRLARQQWQADYEADPANVPPPYLTHAGEIVSGRRLENFLHYVGRHESNYYAYKEKTTDYDELRKTEAKYGHEATPSDEILRAKEDADRIKYRELIREAVQQNGNGNKVSNFTPVMASKVATSMTATEAEQLDKEEQGKLEQRMGNLLQNSIGKDTNSIDDYDPKKDSLLVIDETDFKGRYYADKFGWSPYDAESHMALRKAYIEGLVWNLKYYYHSHKTNLSWEWFYRFHYGPMISDLIDVDSLLAGVSFEGRLGAPLKPFEQLLACLPASQAKLLPGPYRKLMTDSDSPIRDFYPESFTVDMNGKRWPWEAVVLLPFIDSQRLKESAASISKEELEAEELLRNDFYDALVLKNDGVPGKVSSEEFGKSKWALPDTMKAEPCFRPDLDSRVIYPLDGLPTLRDGSVHGMYRRRIYVNVHGNKSRYQTAVLEVSNEIPDLIPLETLASLIGQTIYINYPFLIESFVTAVSNSNMYCRGEDPPKLWNPSELSQRKERVRRIINSYGKGLGMTGTGGVKLAGMNEETKTDPQTLLYVRPLKGLKTLSDGTVVKTFAKYEIEVPLFVLSWAPVEEDKRLKGIPLQLEKDPFHTAKRVLTDASGANTSVAASEPMSPRNQFPLRDMYPGNGPSESGRFQRFSGWRGLSTLAAPLKEHKVQSNGAVSFLSPTTRLLPKNKSPLYLMGARKINGHARGRMITAGVLFMAVVFGFKPVNAAQFPLSTDVSGIPLPTIPSMLGDAITTASTDPMPHRSTPPLEFLHGTTTLSFKFQGGIVAAVDSRASLGNYVGSKTTQKVLPIHKSMLGTMAGGAADCTYFIRRLAAEAALHEVTYDGKLMSVARASRLLANSLYQNRNAGLSIGTMIMGFDSDKENSPPRIFYVDNSGMRVEGDMFAVGSGSTYAQGILDTERRYDMTDKEAISLGLKAIRHATFRDAGSGGFINVYLIKRDGWIHVFRQDMAAMHPESNKRANEDRDSTC